MQGVSIVEMDSKMQLRQLFGRARDVFATEEDCGRMVLVHPYKNSAGGAIAKWDTGVGSKLRGSRAAAAVELSSFAAASPTLHWRRQKKAVESLDHHPTDARSAVFHRRPPP